MPVGKKIHAVLLAPAALAALVCALAAGQSARADTGAASFDPLVRVLLARAFHGDSLVSVSSTCGYRALRAGAGLGDSLVVPAGRVVPVSSSEAAAAGGILLTPGESITLEESSRTPDQVFTIQAAGTARRYRGDLIVSCAADGALRIVDCVPLDDYLKGVIGPEIGAGAPLEALKAQAIAARTYAVKNFGKCAADTPGSGGPRADLDDTTRCQNYGGYDAENWRTRTAVEQTGAKILTFEGAPIDAVYATDCGGATGAGREPYLKSVADPGCASESPWTVCVPLEQLGAAAIRAGTRTTGRVVTARIGPTDPSGRVASVSVVFAQWGDPAPQDGEAQPKTAPTSLATSAASVSATDLRRALGYDKLRSTLFTLSVDPSLDRCVFTGRGWGHGLGMCQRGAVAMARDNAATCDQILHHYYTGVEVSDLTSDLLQADGDSSRDAFAPATSQSPAIPRAARPAL